MAVVRSNTLPVPMRASSSMIPRLGSIDEPHNQRHRGDERYGRHLTETSKRTEECRTIVESHGGRLWASADTGCAATFHFSLPAEVRVLQSRRKEVNAGNLPGLFEVLLG